MYRVCTQSVHVNTTLTVCTFKLFGESVTIQKMPSDVTVTHENRTAKASLNFIFLLKSENCHALFTTIIFVLGFVAKKGMNETKIYREFAFTLLAKVYFSKNGDSSDGSSVGFMD